MDLYKVLEDIKKRNGESMTEFNQISQNLVNIIIKALKNKVDEKRITEVLNGSWFDLKDDMDQLNEELKSLPNIQPVNSRHWLFL